MMADEAAAAKLQSPLRTRGAFFAHVDSGVSGLWVLIVVSALVVVNAVPEISDLVSRRKPLS